MAAELTERAQDPNARRRARLRRGRSGALGMGGVALIIGVIALILGASGLAIALGNMGKAGATGATGPSGAQGPGGLPGTPGANGKDGTNGKNGTNGLQGLPGPGAVVNQTYDVNSTGLNTTCVPYQGSDVNVTVAGPGILVVTASIGITLFHTATNYTIYSVSLGNGSKNCNAFDNNAVAGESPGTDPTGYYDVFLGLGSELPDQVGRHLHGGRSWLRRDVP